MITDFKFQMEINNNITEFINPSSLVLSQDIDLLLLEKRFHFSFNKIQRLEPNRKEPVLKPINR